MAGSGAQIGSEPNWHRNLLSFFPTFTLVGACIHSIEIPVYGVLYRSVCELLRSPAGNVPGPGRSCLPVLFNDIQVERLRPAVDLAPILGVDAANILS